MISIDADQVLHVVSRTRAVGEDTTPSGLAERPRRSALAAGFDRAQDWAERAARRARAMTSHRSLELADALLEAATEIAQFDEESAHVVRALSAEHFEIGNTR